LPAWREGKRFTKDRNPPFVSREEGGDKEAWSSSSGVRQKTGKEEGRGLFFGRGRPWEVTAKKRKRGEGEKGNGDALFSLLSLCICKKRSMLYSTRAREKERGDVGVTHPHQSHSPATKIGKTSPPPIARGGTT